MRNRLLLAALAACLALAGCRSKQKVKVQATEEEAPSLASTVHVADPRVACTAHQRILWHRGQFLALDGRQVRGAAAPAAHRRARRARSCN